MPLYIFTLSREYMLRQFERNLAKLEIRNLFTGNNLRIRANGTTISCKAKRRVSSELLHRLGFTHSVRVTERSTITELITDQTFLNRLPRIADKELSARALETVRARKREHSYATHGFHPYKGKYYPQLVRVIINSCLTKTTGVVLDPFCGSGTTPTEACLQGLNSIGVDFNPLAALIARVKTESLSIPVAALDGVYVALSSKLQTRFLENGLRVTEEPTLWSPPDAERCQELYSSLPKENLGYLQKWFDPIALAELAVILDEIQALTKEAVRDFCRIALSAFIRDVSLQEPSSLRILRRQQPPENPRILHRFLSGIQRRISALKVLHLLDHRFRANRAWSRVIQGDAKQLPTLLQGVVAPGEIDCVVTSPPYAMALPYIDTDRLSLFLLGLLKVEERADTELDMVGNREISDRVRKRYEDLLESPETTIRLPASVLGVIHSIKRANDKALVGFRKRNTPALLLKYFLDMEEVFRHCARYLRRGGHLVYVVGANRTVPGKDGRPVAIQTDELLADIGRALGLRVKRRSPMTDQATYMRHSRNFIQSESIVFLEKR